jgi:hypothetical protein
MTRKCRGTNKRNEPCRAGPLKGGDHCAAHDPNRPDADRFGSSVQAARAGASDKPRVPKLTEVLTRRVEAEAEAIVGALFEGLDATSGMAIRVGRGVDEIVDVPDYGTRLRAAQLIFDRMLGRPKQQTEITGAEGGPLEVATLIRPDPERAQQVGKMLRDVGALGPDNGQ